MTRLFLRFFITGFLKIHLIKNEKRSKKWPTKHLMALPEYKQNKNLKAVYGSYKKTFEFPLTVPTNNLQLSIIKVRQFHLSIY